LAEDGLLIKKAPLEILPELLAGLLQLLESVLKKSIFGAK
jgi:hypothetical protein